MTTTSHKSKSVIIVGGGTIGLSTAWSLSANPSKYNHITILDPYPPPSYASAGYDINKIVRTEYAQPIYTKIAQEAIEIWDSSPIFRDHWFKAGYLNGTFEPGPDSEWDMEVENTKKYGDASQLQLFGDDLSDVFEKTWPEFQNGPPPAFRAAYNANGGWVNATGAMEALAKHLQTIDTPKVDFISGEKGKAVKLLRQEGRVIGVESEDGSLHHADIVVLSMGAWTPDLINFEGQAWPGMSFATKIQLDKEETKTLGKIPVVDIIGPGDLDSQTAGYFFPPTSDGVFKLVAKVKNHNRYTKFLQGKKVPPLPSEAHEPSDKLPLQDALDYRKGISWWLPQISKKPFTGSYACWDLVTFDEYWIIGPHPSSPESLFVATGGNGHTFKNLVNVGKYVAQAIEGTLDPELKEAFRWRSDRAGDQEATARQNDIDAVQEFIKDGVNVG